MTTPIPLYMYVIIMSLYIFSYSSNMKSVMIQGTVFGVAQASIFFIYSAGFTLGAYQVVQDPSSPIYASYDAVFR